MSGRAAFTAAISLLVAMAAGSLLILAYGESPGAVYHLLLARTWGEPYGIGQVLFKATPLLFTGLAFAVARRAGLFNIGAEGQMVVGSLATAAVGAGLPAATPAPLAIALCVGAGCAAGGLLGAVPGWLKARFGGHEVINTIMLNFIAAAIVVWVGRRWLFTAETTHTREVIAAARLPELGIAGSAANASLFLALAAAAAVWWLLARTRSGFALRAVGQGRLAAEAAGIRIGATMVLAMALSGALAGAVGACNVLGYKQYFEVSIGRGTGFMGIAVALLGRSHPLGVVAAALLFGTLAQGGFAVSERVPRELVDVLQAIVILAVVATSAELARDARRAPGGA